MTVVYAYVDEAGDLGLKGSKYFVVAYLITQSNSDIELIQRKSKRLLKGINVKLRPKRKISEFKFSQDTKSSAGIVSIVILGTRSLC